MENRNREEYEVEARYSTEEYLLSILILIGFALVFLIYALITDEVVIDLISGFAIGIMIYIFIFNSLEYINRYKKK